MASGGEICSYLLVDQGCCGGFGTRSLFSHRSSQWCEGDCNANLRVSSLCGHCYAMRTCFPHVVIVCSPMVALRTCFADVVIALPCTYFFVAIISVRTYFQKPVYGIVAIAAIDIGFHCCQCFSNVKLGARVRCELAGTANAPRSTRARSARCWWRGHCGPRCGH